MTNLSLILAINFRVLTTQLEMYEILAMLLAAAIHDFDHPGCTNNFLIATGDPLGLFYLSSTTFFMLMFILKDFFAMILK